MADAPCEGGLVEHSHRYDYRIFNHPGQFGYDSSDPQSVTEYRAQFAQAAQRSALYPPPPSLSTSYQREHFSECCQVMLTVTASAGVV